MSGKNAFIANQKNSLAETLRTSLKAVFYIQKLLFARAFLRCPQKNSHFHEPKVFLSHKPFLLPSKATLFHPPPPISTPLNLLFAKNTAVLLISALNSYAVKPERRTDSNHCRRYPEKCSFQHSRLPDEHRSLLQKHRIDRRFESWVAGLRPACFLVTFCTMQKVTTRSPSQEISRFRKPRMSTPQPQFRTATIKTFLKELRGSQTSNQHTTAAASHRNN